jgi:hypothetical protein
MKITAESILKHIEEFNKNKPERRDITLHFYNKEQLEMFNQAVIKEGIARGWITEKQLNLWKLQKN